MVFFARSYGVMVGYNHLPDTNFIALLVTDSPMLLAAATHLNSSFIQRSVLFVCASGAWVIGLAWLHSELLQPPALTYGWPIVFPILLVLTHLFYKALRVCSERFGVDNSARESNGAAHDA